MRYERSFAIAKRLADLLALIESGIYSSPTLAAKLGVSEQTVYRDIFCLRQRGHSIRSVKHSSGWAYEITEAAAQQSGEGQRE